MEKYGTIYILTNKITGMKYVGQTTGSVTRRFNAHAAEKRNRHISNAINSYGKDNFTVEELATAFDLQKLNELEVYFLDYYNTMFPNGYNHRVGGEQNGKCSQETKEKISKSKTGKSIEKLKNRKYSLDFKLRVSRTLGGQRIVGVSLETSEIIVYETAHATKIHGHNPSNIVQICKKNSGRQISKGYKFYYMNDYANQSGSTEIKILEHAQRIGIETAKAE